MSGFRVSLDELDDTINRLSRFATALEEHFDRVDAQVRELSSTWSGAAASAQQAAHARWRSGAREMSEALRVMHSAASTAHENYSAAGSTNRSIWQL